MEVPLEAVIAGFDQLVGDSPEMPVNPLGILLIGVKVFASSYALIVFPGNDILAVGFVQRDLIVIENIFLDGAFIRVNLR